MRKKIQPTVSNFRFTLRGLQTCKQYTDWLICILFQSVNGDKEVLYPQSMDVVKHNNQVWVSDNFPSALNNTIQTAVNYYLTHQPEGTLCWFKATKIKYK